MAVRFMDPGGRWYAGFATSMSPYSFWAGAGSATAESTGGRWGVGCVRLANGTVTGVQRYVGANFGGTGLDVRQVVGGYVVATPNRATVGVGSALLALAQVSGTIVLTCHALSDGSIVVTNAAGATLASSAPGAVNLSVGAWVEFAAEIAVAGGSVAVYVDGVAVCSASGIATATGTARGRVHWYNPRDDTATAATWNDLVIQDATLTPLGPHRVRYLLVNGDGSATAWTPNVGARWQAVDEMPPDGDTTYVTNLAGGTALFTVSDEAGGDPPTIVTAVAATLQARREGGGGGVTVVIASGASESSLAVAVIFSYGPITRIAETNPDTGAAWTWAAAQAVQIGPRLVSSDGIAYRATQVVGFALTSLASAPPPATARVIQPVWIGL